MVMIASWLCPSEKIDICGLYSSLTVEMKVRMKKIIIPVLLINVVSVTLAIVLGKSVKANTLATESPL